MVDQADNSASVAPAADKPAAKPAAATSGVRPPMAVPSDLRRRQKSAPAPAFDEKAYKDAGLPGSSARADYMRRLKDGVTPAAAEGAPAGVGVSELASEPDGGPTIKIGDDDVSEQTVRDALRLHADDAARKANIPAEPSGYKAAMPPDVVLPDGVDFAFDTQSEMFTAATEFAHRHKFDQVQFSEMLGLYAGEQAREMVMINSARAEEQKKLGLAGPARVDAVALQLASRLGEKRGLGLLQRLVLASDLESMEMLLRDSSSGSGFNQMHREGRPPEFDEDAYQASGPPGSVARVRFMQKHSRR